MEDLRKRLDEVILDIQKEKLEIMRMLSPMSIKECNSNATKGVFDLRSLNEKILPRKQIV
jgi:hypothetical protein